MAKKKTTRRKISAQEKLKVLQLLSEGKTFSEIANELERPDGTVGKIINEVRGLADKAFFSDNDSNPSTSVNDLDVDVHGRVMNKLIKNGISEDEAVARIKKVCNNCEKQKIEKITEEELYTAALSILMGSHLFGSKSKEKGQNVTIMTPAASERGDAQTKKSNMLHKNIDDQKVFRI